MRDAMVRDLTPDEREQFGISDRAADAILALIQQDRDLRTSPAGGKDCTCSTDPLDNMPLVDGRCPTHGCPLPVATSDPIGIRSQAQRAATLYDETLAGVQASPVGSVERRLHSALGDLAHVVLSPGNTG